MTVKDKLNKLKSRYEGVKPSNLNFAQGGGLSDEKFASVRHEHAKRDNGKETVGLITAKLHLATGEPTPLIRCYIRHLFPNLEWHHAGKLPARYGGGMKKTYFINSEEIVLLINGIEQGLELFKKQYQQSITN